MEITYEEYRKEVKQHLEDLGWSDYNLPEDVVKTDYYLELDSYLCAMEIDYDLNLNFD